MKLRHVLTLLCFVATAPLGRAQSEDVRAQALLSHDKLAPGQNFRVAVVIDLGAPWHINANPAAESMIPTSVTWPVFDAGTITNVTYPPGKPVTVEWAETPVSLYEGRVVVLAEGRVRNEAPRGPLKLTGRLRYQACNDKVCLAPKSLWLVIDTEIGDAGKPIHPEIFGAQLPTAPAPNTEAPNAIDQLIRERGLFLALTIVFLGGLALNLTPCVYPMIAITVSYFGASEGRTRGQAFVGALVYCLGIVISYTVLGVIAALTGGLFGALLQSKWVLVGIAGLLVVLALSMFGLFEIRPPQFLVQRAAGMSSRAGQIGVFFLGATMGIIAAPCLAPFAVALLAYVGASRQWWWFLAFSSGLALPYLVLGTFSGLLSQLPKSGTWMVWVKRVFGVALIGVAWWFVKPTFASRGTPASPIAWQKYAPELLAKPGKPVLVDFYADWCIPCHEMDNRTFTDSRIIEASKRFLMLKADLTRTGSPDIEKLTGDFHIAGVPTFVFFSADGKELAQLRQVGFVPADKFAEVMAQAQTAVAPTNAATSAANVPPELMRPF